MNYSGYQEELGIEVNIKFGREPKVETKAPLERVYKVNWFVSKLSII